MEGSRYFESPLLYKENGFRGRKDAEAFLSYLEQTGEPDAAALVDSLEKKKETKNPPLLYNLAELQNDCSKYFKKSWLNIINDFTFFMNLCRSAAY